MKTTALRAALLAAAGTIAFAIPAAAFAAATDSVPDTAGDEQATSANQAGQANDRFSLTSADIIVTGSKTAQDAPITSSLTTTQPQSAVSRDYIDNANAGADFFTLIALTPSVNLTGNSNGTGFTETKASIRGFQDGEYNVTYDSIPFSDTNNPTHHSTAFFPSNTIETVVVDRGPGNASQLGQATYGGNINLYSRAAGDTRSVEFQGLYGSFNSFIGRATVQTGKVASLDDAKFVVSAEYLKSDGAQTFSPVESKNIYAKGVIPIGSSTLTVMSTLNRNHYYQSDTLKGATCGAYTTANPAPAGTTLTLDNCAPTSNIGMHGIDYGLGDDPTQVDYWKYNRTDKTTDFSYVRLQSDLGSGFSMDNRVYMFGYTNHTLTGNGTFAAGYDAINKVTVFAQKPVTVITGFSGAGTAASPYKAIAKTGDVPGYDKLNKYRAYGYIGQLNYDFSIGKIRLGGWYEHSDSWRHTYDFDWNTGLPSYDQKFADGTAANSAQPSTALANIAYDQNSGWNQFELFGEFELRPTEGLSITPGVKYVHFERSIDALVNQKSRTPIQLSATWTKTLPFLTANWQVASGWSFYGEYAQGMYIPDLSSFYSRPTAALTNALADLKPQTSTNYQIGTVWHGARISIDADAYLIDVNNKIGTCTTVGCDTTLLINIGAVHYRGFEGSVAYMPIAGLTLFANASYNYAQSVSTGAQVAKAPFSTAAAGFIYHKDGLRVSYNQKFTGPAYATQATVGATDPRNYRIAPYSIGEFAISQEIGEVARIGLTISNIFDKRVIYDISAGKAYGVDDQFSIMAPRQVMADLRVKF
ncbi:TonB-dependent receptor [Sphingobium nicotianae]|uniref:TonB-dependent receptor n=1 Tax=Sphingobium nicotianae TaxID=2782607 RepID=A0A9X1DDZ6_9SPHN|nr:TonB-dependent receptor [Sphingobium nicotianae]MBT2188291.1 TonB-dependent receptor [Sphingobium nicotianae]